ncbi:hypothetical protein B0J12DRAFT_713715 [Macrophomina phaseolina]|uniref:Monooxygenase FAD-binding protein n=1 Tax=Macrophomina phaseolina TaxID=35725 RepID=A0ABQ8FWZ9_9PEZI|nr:hypothetical protein B0J12DRAFT_713715 [Macrophomina phaseolina]
MNFKNSSCDRYDKHRTLLPLLEVLLRRHLSIISIKRNLNIAIVGSGIAGVTLPISLLRANVAVTLYESAQAFGEIGAGVVFGPNAVRAMSPIAPEVRTAFETVATYNQLECEKKLWFDFRHGMFRGGQQSELICSLPAPDGRAAVHRAHYLAEIVKLVPNGVANVGKKLQDVENLPDGKIQLIFLDGSEAVHDALIGCDGIKSRTRQVVLGDDHPAAKARWSGKYAYSGLIPMDKAVELLSDELARNSQMYLGYQGHVLTFPVEHGRTMNAVLTYVSSAFGSITSLMQRIDIWALFEHPAAPRYTRDNICLIGDAAHAATPHQGALLREVNDAEDIQAAFTAFQKERIELARTSHEAGQLYDFELPGYEDDDGMIAENLKTRMRWIWDEDLEKELERAMITLKAEIKTATCMGLHVLERKSVTTRIASDQAGIS